MLSTDRAAAAAVSMSSPAELKPLYLEALALVERLHRRLLDVIKDEFDRAGRTDVNSVQALLLFNIGDSELTASELRSRGYYLGSNVSYNLKKLVDMGFIRYERSRLDRRSVRVSLTENGRELGEIVSRLCDRHIDLIDDRDCISAGELVHMKFSLKRLERFLTDQIVYRL